MSSLLSRAVTIKRWQNDPVSFFKDVTGFDAYGHQIEILNWCKDLDASKLIVVGGTGGGKTYCLAAVALWHVMCIPPITGRPFRAAIAAGGLAQAKRTYEYVMEFCNKNRTVRNWIKGDPLKSEVRFMDNSWIAPIPSSDTQLYNLHADMFVIDEAAQAGDKVLAHAPRIVGSQSPNRIVISGHFVDDPMCYVSNFVDIWTNDHEYPRTEWTKIHYTSLDIPWIEQSAIEMARKVMSADQFKTVWEAALPELTSTLFDIKAIRASRLSDLPAYSGKNPVYMAIDWGFGPSAAAILVAEVDMNEADPLDTDYVILYAKEYPQKTGPWMQKEINRIAGRYNVARIRADSSHSQENYRIKQKGWIVDEVVFRALKGRMQERTRVLLERQKVHIFRGFDTLLKELIAYRLDTKKDDHLVDCLQMLTWQRDKNWVGDYYFAKRKYKRGLGIRR